MLAPVTYCDATDWSGISAVVHCRLIALPPTQGERPLTFEARPRWYRWVVSRWLLLDAIANESREVQGH